MTHTSFLSPVPFYRLAILALLIGAGFLSLAASAQVTLVRDGQATAAIITADTPTPTAQYAAEELVWHVKKATGVALPVHAESGAPEGVHTRVYIGDTAAGRHLGLDPVQLARETWIVRSVGNDLFLAGREDDGDPFAEDNPNVGPLFAVYEFVERALGARWLWPGELGTYIPPADTVEIPAITLVETPSLQFRRFYWYMIRNVSIGSGTLDPADARFGFSPEGARAYGEALQVLLRRHRQGGLDAKPPTGHAFSGWWQKYGKEHPEWFAMRKDGVRGSLDPEAVHVDMCVSNPGLHDFIVSQWDGESVLLLGPVDRPGRCACEQCQAWDAPQPETPPWFAERVYKTDRRAQESFSGVTSDRYARFWRAILEKAKARNPHALVSMSFIYENEFPAPQFDIHLGRQIYGEFVQWQDPHLRWFPMHEEPYAWIREQWLGWRKTGMRMGYRPNYLHDGYVMPHFETRQSGEFFQFAWKHGMEGASFDSLTGQWAVHGPRLYMHLRLMQDPERDLDAIRAEYYDAFGPAADTMRRYFEYWEDYAFENQMRFLKLFWDIGHRYRVYPLAAHHAFPEAAFAPAQALLTQARQEAAAGGARAEFADRVQFIQTGLDHARLATKVTALFDGQELPPEANRDAARDAVEELVAFRKAHEHLFFSDLLWVTSYWERENLNFEELMK